MSDFYDELRVLSEKYPMCYIEAWTPEDYFMMKHKDQNIEDIQDKLNWNDEEWVQVSEKLYDTFDANHGTNWHKLFHIVENTTCEH